MDGYTQEKMIRAANELRNATPPDWSAFIMPPMTIRHNPAATPGWFDPEIKLSGLDEEQRIGVADVVLKEVFDTTIDELRDILEEFCPERLT